MTTATTQAPAGAPVRWEAWLGVSGRIPRKVGTCPECNRTLAYQVMSCDSAGAIELSLDCGAPFRNRWGDVTHRHWQGDWQHIIAQCEDWVRAHPPNNEVRHESAAPGVSNGH